MKNFGRALRLALIHRWKVASLFACALMVGLLWGANIGTIYPMVEIAFKGQTPQEWVQGKIDEAHARIERLDADRTAEAHAPDSNAGRVRNLSRAIEVEQKAVGFYQGLQPYVEAWLPHDPFQMLMLILGVLIVGTMLKSCFFVAHSVVSDCLVGLTAYELRRRFYRKSLTMDQSRFTADGTSDLMSRFTFDMDCLASGLKFLTQVGTREPLKMLACFAGAALICWRLLLFSLIVVPLGVWAIARLSKLLKRANRRAMEGMSRLYGVLKESLGGIAVVKAFTMERHERRRFHDVNKDYYLRTMRIARYDALTSPVTELIGISTISVTILVGAYLGLSGETHVLGIQLTERPLDVGTLLTFYALIAGMSDPARKLSGLVNRLQRASAAADRIYTLLDLEPAITNAQPATAPKVVHSESLRFVGLQFAYHDDAPVLRGVDLDIRAGETIALVGPNGCGKSTLLQMVPRFYDPDAGAVLLDNVDIRTLRLQDLRGQLGLVTQEPVLFHDTVFNNIRYGRSGASEEEVLDAARRAHAHEFIVSKLPEGYQTMVSEGGATLSGGQRQRIALARAMLRNPRILILDEATSQIDLESERLIHQALHTFTRNRTTLIVTHRLSTLELADRIAVMQGGRLVDVGTHHELLGRCDFYRRMNQTELRESA